MSIPILFIFQYLHSSIPIHILERFSSSTIGHTGPLPTVCYEQPSEKREIIKEKKNHGRRQFTYNLNSQRKT